MARGQLTLQLWFARSRNRWSILIGAGTGAVKNGATPAPKKDTKSNKISEREIKVAIELTGQGIVYANTKSVYTPLDIHVLPYGLFMFRMYGAGAGPGDTEVGTFCSEPEPP